MLSTIRKIPRGQGRQGWVLSPISQLTSPHLTSPHLSLLYYNSVSAATTSAISYPSSCHFHFHFHFRSRVGRESVWSSLDYSQRSQTAVLLLSRPCALPCFACLGWVGLGRAGPCEANYHTALDLLCSAVLCPAGTPGVSPGCGSFRLLRLPRLLRPLRLLRLLGTTTT